MQYSLISKCPDSSKSFSYYNWPFPIFIFGEIKIKLKKKKKNERNSHEKVNPCAVKEMGPIKLHIALGTSKIAFTEKTPLFFYFYFYFYFHKTKKQRPNLLWFSATPHTTLIRNFWRSL